MVSPAQVLWIILSWPMPDESERNTHETWTLSKISVLAIRVFILKRSRGQTFFSYWVTWTLKLKHFKNCCFSYINTWARIYVFESELKWKQLRSDPWKWIDFKICTILNYILITCLSGKQTRSSQYIHISKQINFVEEKAIWDKLILIQEKLLNGMFVYRVCILKWYVNMSCL